MSRSAVRPALVVVALVGAAWPAAVRAQSREVRLPPLEVPDEIARARRAMHGVDRSALLGQEIELSDERDRRTLSRERTAWGRLYGSLCSGCGETGSSRRAGTVDPVAVLNAKRVSTLSAMKPAVIRRPLAVVASTAATVPAAGTVRIAAESNAATPVAAKPVPDRPVAARPVAASPAPAKPAASRSVGLRPVLSRPAATGATAAPAVAGSTAPTAKPTRQRLALLKRTIRSTHAHRVQLAHRRGHRSKLASYLGKVRYTLLRWRHHRPHSVHRRLRP